MSNLTAENTELYQENMMLRNEINEMEELVEALRRKISLLARMIPQVERPPLESAFRTGAASGAPAVVQEGWIVDEIPSLHRAYCNLGPNGYWKYWEELPDGRYKWNPKWIESE